MTLNQRNKRRCLSFILTVHYIFFLHYSSNFLSADNTFGNMVHNVYEYNYTENMMTYTYWYVLHLFRILHAILWYLFYKVIKSTNQFWGIHITDNSLDLFHTWPGISATAHSLTQFPTELYCHKKASLP